MTKFRGWTQSLLVALEPLEAPTPAAGTLPAEAEDCLEAYQRQLDYLAGSLRRLGVPHSDVEDVLHDVFLVMLTRWEEYDRTRPIKPWLFGIAFRVASSHRRKGTREVLGGDHDPEDERILPDDHVAAGQSRALLLSALGRVPLERRAVLIMHEVDETPMRQIAEQLSIPLFTAYSRLRKARQELDAALTQLQGGRRAR